MSFTYQSNLLHVEKIALNEIADHHPTPCYIYSSSRLENNFRVLKEAFDENMPGTDVLLAYACKANGSLAILKTLADLGCGADIVSGGEMKRALAAGIPPEKIVFSGVGKSREEIEMAVRENIAQVNIESAAEMDLISKVTEDLKKTLRISFRLNPDVDAKTHDHTNTGKKESKFGISPELIKSLYKKACYHKYLDPQGLSIHIGSQLTRLEPFEDAFEIIHDLARDLIDEGLPLSALDLGGGVGISYSGEKVFTLPEYIALIKKRISSLGVRLILEPGRSISGDTGVLLSRVLYTKKAGSKNLLIVDAGMNDFIRPCLYDADHPVYPVMQEDVKGENESGRSEVFDIVGPVCETADVLAKNISLPKASTEPNALIAFMMSGAYGSVMASFYNARPLPAEIMVKGDKIAQIRSRITTEDILAHEKMPEWLEN